MTNRLLGEGQDVSYRDLTGQLEDGEVLAATWLRDPLNIPNAGLVGDEGIHESIASKTEYGYYVELRWFASSTVLLSLSVACALHKLCKNLYNCNQVFWD